MRELKNHLICANPECGFSAVNDSYTLGCPECGSEVLYTCPHCEPTPDPAPIIYKGQTFCVRCRQRLKPPPAPKASKQPRAVATEA